MNEIASRALSVRRSEDGLFTIFTLSGAYLVVENDPKTELFLHTNPAPTLHESALSRRPLLKVPAVAETLGLSQSKVHEMLRTGEIPSIKIDKSRRVRPDDLDEFIARHQVASATRGL